MPLTNLGVSDFLTAWLPRRARPRLDTERKLRYKGSRPAALLPAADLTHCGGETMRIYAFDLMPWPYLETASIYPDANRLFDPQQGHELYAQHLRQIQEIEACGFDAICFNEHHASPYGLMPSPNLMAAAVSQRTQRLKIAILGNLPALHAHPVRLAEEIAMLDVMSGGRIVSGFVRGVTREYLAYSVPLEDARARVREAWDLIVKAWTEREPFAWHGEYFHYDRVSIWPRPLQQPHPPIVFPAESDEGLELAARHRVPTGAAYRSTAACLKIFERYRALARRQGWTPQPHHHYLLRHIYVAATREQARAEAEAHLHYFWQRLLSYHQGVLTLLGHPLPSPPTQGQHAEDLPFWEFDFDLCQREGISIIGTPEDVIQELRAQSQTLGCGVIMGLFQFGSMPHALAMKNIRLFAQEVLSEVQKA
jgi:alkanesulfonate monooxygenase SsuD/methylene tetrahydromethanopterin reductase-like flavin-dependent oxidoreductase (luciferase family)